MNDDKLDGRALFVWHGPNDIGRLAETIAEKAAAELFELDGTLVYLNATQKNRRTARRLGPLGVAGYFRLWR
jgi:hypothetical protein